MYDYSPLNEVGDTRLVGIAFACLERSVERGDVSATPEEYARIQKICGEYKDLNKINAWFDKIVELAPDLAYRRPSSVEYRKGTWWISVNIGDYRSVRYVRDEGFSLHKPLTRGEKDDDEDSWDTPILLTTYDVTELTEACLNLLKE